MLSSPFLSIDPWPALELVWRLCVDYLMASSRHFLLHFVYWFEAS